MASAAAVKAAKDLKRDLLLWTPTSRSMVFTNEGDFVYAETALKSKWGKHLWIKCDDSKKGDGIYMISWQALESKPIERIKRSMHSSGVTYCDISFERSIRMQFPNGRVTTSKVQDNMLMVKW